VRLLVTGGSGFIGGRALERAPSDWELTATYLRHPCDSPGTRWHRLDLRDAPAVETCLMGARPSVILHTAYSKAEPEAVIAHGTRHLVEAAGRVGARVLLISTDQVFDGRRGGYREGDRPAPVNPYGQAKWTAERAVQAAGGCVVRTSLVYRLRPPDPTNADLILAPLARGQRPRLFTDEYRSPIYLDDLVDALLELAAWPPGAWGVLPAGGVLHVAGPERLDRYTFGCRLAPCLAVEARQLEASTLGASGLARPADCSLDSAHARACLRTALRSLAEVLGA
jgi:dTDP-4-dehydrorhamnose reductase